MEYFDGLVQDYSISIANALEILQSCTKPSICSCCMWKRKRKESDIWEKGLRQADWIISLEELWPSQGPNIVLLNRDKRRCLDLERRLVPALSVATRCSQPDDGQTRSTASWSSSGPAVECVESDELTADRKNVLDDSGSPGRPLDDPGRAAGHTSCPGGPRRRPGVGIVRGHWTLATSGGGSSVDDVDLCL